MAFLFINPRASILATVQGLYWLATGIWPFVHLPSFLRVTGPKEDIWLLYTVSILITVIGGVLLASGVRKQVTHEIKWLGIAGAAGLAGIDVFYALGNVIWDVYLLDALVEIFLIILWICSGRKGLQRIGPDIKQTNN